MILTRLNALQYTKVKVIFAPYEGKCAQSYFLPQALPAGFKRLKIALKSQRYSTVGAALTGLFSPAHPQRLQYFPSRRPRLAHG